MESEADSVTSGADFATTQLPAFLNERQINAILSNPEDDLKYKKQQIEMYFSAHSDLTERADYLKSAYQDRFTELLVGIGRTRVGYKPQEDGLLMWEGAYLSRTSESVFSWQLVAELTAQIIERGEYHINRDIKGLKSQDSQQMSLFDAGSFSVPESAPSAETVSYGIRYSQQVIDEALCIGANDRNSRLIVCAYFMKDKPLEENARFLMRHYKTNGAGFYLNDRQYAIWYSGEGIRLSSGDSAQGGTAMLISWTDAAKHIRELLVLGRYMPQTELDRVQDYEYQQIAGSLWYLRQDFDDGAREQALLPTVNGIYMSHGGIPENTAQIAELLKQPDSLQTLVDEVSTFISAYESDRDILRFHFHRPREILLRLTDLQREPLIFTASDGYDPQRRQFITMDEIDKLLRSGNIYYRLGVYSYYLEHPEIKERAGYLQSYHGDSGSYGGNDNTSYGSKGLSFSHGDIMAPYAKLDWSWTKAARRIETLIHYGSFLSDEDRAAMPEYERRELATVIQGAFFDLTDGQPRPFSHNPLVDYWENVEEIQAQLTDPAKVEEIYRMLISVADGTKPEDRYYISRQEALAAMISYREGTYSLFGEKREPRPIYMLPQDTEPQELKTAKELINLYCQETFESDADFDSLSHVDLAYTSTGDHEHTIEVYADLVNFKITYAVDGESAYLNECQSLAELNEYLAGLDFDAMIADAEDAFTKKQQEQPAAESTDRVDEMLRQAMLAAELSEQTGQNVFAFDEGSLQPVNVPTPAPAEEQPATLTPPKPRRERVEFSVLHPEIPAEKRHDFHITDPELGYGTPTEKYNANVEAIRTLKKIESEGRLATPEEQTMLSRYVGWGGLADCFDERSSHYEELKSLLSEEEYAAARASTLTAFYTSPVIIEAVYNALSQMGFQAGNILEPACGVGNFIGMLPGSMSGSRAYGVELDSISGRIAQQLYQNSRIAVDGFEKVQMPDSFFDVAVGNVPFGDFKVLDKQYDKYHWLIHDYFFGKTLDKVRPGGIVAFITSKGTVDKENSAVRKYFAQRADLIGAIRLPDNAFKRNAGTEVTSDIIFLQKRDRILGLPANRRFGGKRRSDGVNELSASAGSERYAVRDDAIEPDWVHLDTDENGIRMNSYFVQHPDMVLGNMVMESTRFGMDSACKAYEDADLSEQLAEAVTNLHAEITAYEVEELTDEVEDRAIPADPAVRNFSFCLSDGTVYYRENSRMYPMEVSVTAENRIRGMIAIRDSVRRLIELQTEDYPDGDIKAEQTKLNRLYDQYTRKYGILNSRGNNLAFGEDASYCLLCSLEVLDEEGNFERKADMFTKRTIRPHVPVTSVDTASEALAVSISEKARVDMAYMFELSGKTEAQKSSDLFMKTQYLDEITGGRGVIFATGTPISNSMVELYTIQRYLQYHTLEEMDMLHFDDWAAAFGETITAIELSPEGSGYRAKTRFAKFYNLPELMSTFKMAADIQTADMLKLPVPKANFHTEVIKPTEIQQEMVAGLAERAEKIRAGGVDPKVDNMLRITNDGRKLALDMRLINPLAADDPNGKVSTCARNIFRIWEQTTEQRGAQLVFCDLSTPKDDGSFNVYDDLKKKLMDKGLPENEIAYIHDANTEARKKELFAKVRSGQVRVLLGSTQKMGAGTNVQDRLVALHDLDCPWRPSDLAQRLGRIVRQGNQNPAVDIYRYVTENTFDAYLYQLVENKQKFIAQSMTSKSPVRVADDIDETALSYSEIKALATGNPLIIEKCNLDMEVGKLNVLKASHLSQKYALEEMVLKKYPQQIQDLKQRITGYEQDAFLAGQHPKPQDGFAGITVMGKKIAEKEDAGKTIIDICTKMSGSGTAEMIGEYRGFFMSISYDGAKNEYQMHLKGHLSHTVVLGADVFGNITRMDNVIDGIAGKLEKVRAELSDTQVQLENAKTEMNAPFAKEAELAEKTARLKELNILLNMDQKDRSLIDDTPEDTTPERPKARDDER